MPRFLVIVAVAAAMIAGACSTSAPSDIAEPTFPPTPTPTSTASDSLEAPATPGAPTPIASVDTPPAPTGAPPALPTPATTPAPPPTPRPISTCAGTSVPEAPLFVWGVADDDVDGGLVAHSRADVNSPITRVLAPNALALRPTGNCAPAPNGAPWFELFNAFDGTYDWVNARYLAPASPACLHGEAYGSRTRSGARDGLANFQQFGPIEGVARTEDGIVAFYPGDASGYSLVDGGDHPANVLEFRWYHADAITIDVPCFAYGPAGPVCLTPSTTSSDGAVRVFAFNDPEPRLNRSRPTDAERTGRLYARPAERGLRDEFVEVRLPGDPASFWYDPAVTDSVDGTCTADENPLRQGTGWDFAKLACTIGRHGTNEPVLSAGSSDPTSSDADHLHNLTSYVDADTDCVRIVIELGSGQWSDDDEPAAELPQVDVRKNTTSTSVHFGDCTWEPECGPIAIGADDRGSVYVASHGIKAFGARDLDRNFYVEILHPPAVSNVTFVENPAQIIVDVLLEPGAVPEWYGGAPTIARRLPTDVRAGTPLVVRGWDRPFEAQGQWRIYRIDDLTQPLDDVAVETLDLVTYGLYMTSDWTVSSGTFVAELPPLEPGLYAVLFGSSAPVDGAYVAAGQVVRAYDASVDPATLPRLDAQIWDRIELAE